MRSMILKLGAIGSLLCGTVAFASDPALTCESYKLKVVSKYDACRFKAYSTSVRANSSPDFGRCSLDRFTAAETRANGECLTTGDQPAIQDFVDFCTDRVAVALSGGALPVDYLTCADDLAACDSDLSSCDGNLSTCQGNLSTTNADLGSCNGNLSSCNGSLSSCQSNLSSTNADLGSCNSDLTASHGNLATCQTNLSSTNADLGTCNGSLTSCNGGLTTCQGNLSSTNADLGTCNGSLTSCNGGLTTCQTNLSTTNADLGACNGNLTTANSNLATCQSSLGTATSGTATVGQVLTGRTFTSSAGIGVTGTMPNNGAVSITPGTASQAIAAGYHNGSGSVAGDADLVAGNIKNGVNLFGVVGTAATSGALLKTGQTTCYDTAGTLVACAGTGQDGELQKGITRSFTDNGNGTVTDNVTGLMWEKQSDDGSIHDKDNVYTWANAFAVKVATLNSMVFAGHNDWRVPNRFELETLLNLSASSPPLYSAFNAPCSAGCTVLTCSCTHLDYHWSSTTRLGGPSGAWMVAPEGFTYNGEKIESRHVRAVRAGN